MNVNTLSQSLLDPRFLILKATSPAPEKRPEWQIRTLSPNIGALSIRAGLVEGLGFVTEGV